MDLNKKANKAIAKFLVRSGHDIIDEKQDEYEFITFDEKSRDLVLVKLYIYPEGETFNDEDFRVTKDERKHFEKYALNFLAKNSKEYGLVDVGVRLDKIGLSVIENDRAFIKHESNCTGSSK